MSQVTDSNRYVYEPSACFDPVFSLPEVQEEELGRMGTKKTNPFCNTIERRIGNTRYLIETASEGDEMLKDLVHRLIFTSQEAFCS